MTPAGYSGTPLPKKLGIKPGHRVRVIAGPPDFDATLGELPEAVTVRRDLRGKDAADVMLFFTTDAKELRERFAALAGRLEKNGGLWICRPKKASGVATDVTDSVVREIGLAAGLVDNKVCAVDETWSGLRFVYRLKDR
ncbi:MAG: DUF3052 family protein [Deltaproteobacteria bacterium]|nr:DUF3052 family protein [Deltaproteobacteria bacterium]MCB9478641.1 DUF3052 family protein [Deltaproteobacteria bacterium]MCB9489828.1 DUF3052 family protein [Deltaproteobacteria bacterium]